MNENNKTLSTGHYLYLVLAFAACYLAIGIPYWQTSYSSVSLPNSLYGPGLLLMFICALFFCSRGTRFLWAATVLGLSAQPPLQLASSSMLRETTARIIYFRLKLPSPSLSALVLPVSVPDLAFCLGEYLNQTLKNRSVPIKGIYVQGTWRACRNLYDLCHWQGRDLCQVRHLGQYDFKNGLAQIFLGGRRSLCVAEYCPDYGVLGCAQAHQFTTESTSPSHG